MMMQRTVLLGAVLISSVLVGCGSEDDPATGDRADEQLDDDVETTDPDDQDDAGGGAGGDVDAGDDAGGADGDDAADDGGTEAADDGGGEASQMGEVTIDQTQSHPNGVELTVHSLRVEQNAIFVDIEAFNGARFDKMLAAFDLAAVIDDTGKAYRYEPPEDNTSLRIESNGTLEGSIAFVGRVGADASSVTVRFNYDREGEPRNPADAENARQIESPSFEFADLPLPNS